MGSNSKIEWTDATWTPVRARRKDTGKVGVHCEKVSPACKNCYAERMNERNLPSHGTGYSFTILNRDKIEIFIDSNILLHPIKWKRARQIFVCSQTDLFGEFVENESIDLVFAVMALCPQHTFQVLTKRPERMREYLTTDAAQRIAEMAMLYTFTRDFYSAYEFDAREADLEHWPLPNVWLGVSAESQEWADKRIPTLLQTPAAKRFVSCEPQLGPIDLTDLTVATGGGTEQWDALDKQEALDAEPVSPNTRLDWVIAGGESGPGARPSNPDWFRSVQQQCHFAAVPFFFKQWGAWGPNIEDDVPYGEFHTNGDWVPNCLCSEGTDGMYRTGKAKAGRLLDFREWNEVPV